MPIRNIFTLVLKNYRWAPINKRRQKRCYRAAHGTSVHGRIRGKNRLRPNGTAPYIEIKTRNNGPISAIVIISFFPWQWASDPRSVFSQAVARTVSPIVVTTTPVGICATSTVTDTDADATFSRRARRREQPVDLQRYPRGEDEALIESRSPGCSPLTFLPFLAGHQRFERQQGGRRDRRARSPRPRAHAGRSRLDNHRLVGGEAEVGATLVVSSAASRPPSLAAGGRMYGRTGARPSGSSSATCGELVATNAVQWHACKHRVWF